MNILAHRLTNEEVRQDIKTAKEEVLQSLNIIMKQKEASVNAENLEKDDAGNLLIKSRSIKDVLIYYPEFKRYEQQTIVVCDLCVDKSDIESFHESNTRVIGIISTEKVEEPVDDTTAQPRTFTNFKQLIKKHVGGIKHKVAL